MSLQPGPFDPSESSSLNPTPNLQGEQGEPALAPPVVPDAQPSPPVANSDFDPTVVVPRDAAPAPQGPGGYPPPPPFVPPAAPYPPPAAPPAAPVAPPAAPYVPPASGQVPPAPAGGYPPPASGWPPAGPQGPPAPQASYQPGPGIPGGQPPQAYPPLAGGAAMAAPAGFGGPGYAPAPTTDSKAIVGLILAIGSWLFCPVVLAIVALILASQSNRDIATSGGRLEGHGINTATKVISWINIVVMILGIIAMVVFFGFLVSSNPEILQTPFPQDTRF